MAAASGEIVYVRNGHFLIDSTWRICRYSTRDQRPLQTGFYLALRPGTSRVYDRRTRYYGPFTSRLLAEKMAAAASYLGLLAPWRGSVRGVSAAAEGSRQRFDAGRPLPQAGDDLGGERAVAACPEALLAAARGLQQQLPLSQHARQLP